MMTIGILGASSQVGSSVALYLKKFPDVRVICFIRSDYSKIFFELFGIEYQRLEENKETALKTALESLDVILDFRYPAVQMHQILNRSKQDIGNTLAAMRPGATYVYMSSIMAYGMPDNKKWIAHYRFPRSSYSYIKRELEIFTVKQGRKRGIRIYNFRLGQVHGFLQSVNASFRKKLGETNVALIDGKKDDLVNTIFIYPLCEAIVSCAKGVHPPGLYTLVSEPQWTLFDLYDYYNREYCNGSVCLEFHPAAEGRPGRSLLQRMIDIARPYRALVETYLLMKLPSLAVSMKGQFRQAQLGGGEERVYRNLEYIDFNLLGTPPLKRIEGLTTDPGTILKMEKEMEDHYQEIILSALSLQHE
jgi:nucleoside-diphosphate-sugar epimerase